MAIRHRIKPRYKTRNEQIVADLRIAAGAGPPIDQEMAIKRKTAEIGYRDGAFARGRMDDPC